MGKCCCTAEIDALRQELVGVRKAAVPASDTSKAIRDLAKEVANLTTEVRKPDAARIQQNQLDAIVNGLIGIRSLILEDREIELAAGLEKDIYRQTLAIRSEMATASQVKDLLQAIAWLRRDILQWLKSLYQELWGKIILAQAAIIAAVLAGFAGQVAILSKAIALQGSLLLRAISAEALMLKSWITLQHGVTQRVVLAALNALRAAIQGMVSQFRCRFEKSPPSERCKFQKQEIVTQKVEVTTQKVEVKQQKVEVKQEKVSVTQQTVDLTALLSKIAELKNALPTIATTSLSVPGDGNQCGADVSQQVRLLKVGGEFLQDPYQIQLGLLKKLYRGITCAPSLPGLQVLQFEGAISRSARFEFGGKRCVVCAVDIFQLPSGASARLNMDAPLNYPNTGWYSWIYANGLAPEERLEYQQNALVPPPGLVPIGIYISVRPAVSATAFAVVLDGESGQQNSEYRSPRPLPDGL